MIYFAYGADMNPGQIGQVCPSYRSIGVARLPHHQLCFPRLSRTWGCASASFTPRRNETVFGVLYDVPAEDVLPLHYRHGFDPEAPPEFNEHEFHDVSVMRVGWPEPVAAKTYVAIPDGTKALPSANYMNLITDGARYHNLPRAYQVVLRAVRTG